MRKFIRFYKAFYKHKATNFQKEEMEFKHDLEHAQRDFQNAIHDHLPNGVNNGSITLLFKARENENLSN